MKILVTAYYVSGTVNEGGSGRFMKCVIDTMKDMGYDVTATTYPRDDAFRHWDVIICSHHDQLEYVRWNAAKKIYISHGVVAAEKAILGADFYVSVSEEAQASNLVAGFESVVIGQPVMVREKTELNKTLQNILVIRRDTDVDHFGFLKGRFDLRYSDPGRAIEDQIAWADMCITLGRGAIESMAQGKTVLVADHRPYIGAMGDGYLTKRNVAESAKCNFSGRRFKIPLTREWIEGEIAKYNRKDGDYLHEYAKENHDAVKVVNQYLSLGETRKGSYAVDCNTSL